jgi:HlyD family secretion protein
MSLNLNLCKTLLIFSSLLFYNIKITFLIFSILSILYLLIFGSLKKKLSNQGKKLSKAQSHLIKLAKEGFGSFRELAINKKQYVFSTMFQNSRNIVSTAKTKTEIYSILPRYFVEGIGFIIILGLIITLSSDINNFSKIIITLSIFGISLIKMIPCFQNIYYSISDIKSSIFAYYRVSESINVLNEKISSNNNLKKRKKLNNILFNNVSYNYKEKKIPAVCSLNANIKLNGIYAVIGKTGSGKSTFFNLCLGLLKPNVGEIKVDEFSLSKKSNINAWHEFITYVPQNPFILDATIKENIAFDYDNINEEKIINSIRTVKLENFIEELPEGLNTLVGENATKLSGGQAQRIAIARAIYQDSKIIFLDEATNALDIATEKSILNSLSSLKDKCFFIISHNMTILRYSSNIILFNNGNLKLLNIPQNSHDRDKFIKKFIKHI